MQRSSSLAEDQTEALLSKIENAVVEVVNEFVTNPNAPIDERCLAIREVLTHLETLMTAGLVPVEAACGAGAGAADEGKIPEPLWWALKQVRIRRCSLQECQRLEHIVKEVGPAMMPGLCIQYGWGRARLLAIGCLNQHCLSTLIESLALDTDVRDRVYSLRAPMRSIKARSRLIAQAAALNGVNFDLRHWSSLLHDSSSPQHNSNGNSKKGSSPAQKTASSMTTAEQQEEEAKQMHDELRLRYGATSTASYLLQASPLEHLKIGPRERHQEEIILPTVYPSPKLPLLSPNSSSSFISSSANGNTLPGSPQVLVARGIPHAVVWQFEVKYHDIGFSIVLAHDDVEEEIQAWARHKASGRPIEGWYEVPCIQEPSMAKLILEFDNSYSVRRSKYISLRLALVPLAALETAQLSAHESMESAIWAALAEKAQSRRPVLERGLLPTLSTSPNPTPSSSPIHRPRLYSLLTNVTPPRPLLPSPAPSSSSPSTSSPTINKAPIKKPSISNNESSSSNTSTESTMDLAPTPCLPFSPKKGQKGPAAAAVKVQEKEGGGEAPKTPPSITTTTTQSSSSNSTSTSPASSQLPVTPSLSKGKKVKEKDKGGKGRKEGSSKVEEDHGSEAIIAGASKEGEEIGAAAAKTKGDGGFWSYLSSFTESLSKQMVVVTPPKSSSSSLRSSSPTGPNNPSKQAPSPPSPPAPTSCKMCNEFFGIFRRPHRCRRCQGIFCLPCSRHYVSLGSDAQGHKRPPQRVCDRCYVFIKDQHMAELQQKLAEQEEEEARRQKAKEAEAAAAAGSVGRSNSFAASPVSPRLLPFPPPAPVTPRKKKHLSPYELLKKRADLEKYFKMLTFGVPPTAVGHKMAADGIDEDTMTIFVAGENVEKSSSPSSSPQSNPVNSRQARGQEAYRRSPHGRLSLPLPGGGTSNSTSTLKLRSVHWEELTGERAEKSVFRRKSLVAQSMNDYLSMAGANGGPSGGLGGPSAVVVPRNNVAELAELFSVNKRPKLPVVPGVGKKGPVVGAALDSRRLNNVGIVYSYFKKSFKSTDDIIRTVLGLLRERIPAERLPGLMEILPTPEEQKKVLAVAGIPARSLNLLLIHLHHHHPPPPSPLCPHNMLTGLMEILPTPEEQKKLLAVAGIPARPLNLLNSPPSSSSVSSTSPSNSNQQKKLAQKQALVTALTDAEHFMLSMMKVPRMNEKVRGFYFCLTFPESTRLLEQKMETLARAFGDAMRSDRLVRVLEVLLMIGNTLNAYSGSSAGVVEGFTIDSLFQVALTKSTTYGNVTLLDYFVRLAAEKGEGDILNVAQDMPTVQLAASLPDCSAVIRDVRLWVREFDAVKTEVQKEDKELEGFRRAREERREARRRAEEERLAAIRRAEEAKIEAERRRKEEEEQAAAARREILRALNERLDMEREDLTTHQGAHFVRYLEEAEALYGPATNPSTDDSEVESPRGEERNDRNYERSQSDVQRMAAGASSSTFWEEILGILSSRGPPLPLFLKEVVEGNDGGGQEQEQEGKMDGDGDEEGGKKKEKQPPKQQVLEASRSSTGLGGRGGGGAWEEEEGATVEGVKRLNHQLGGFRGEDEEQQRLLRAASRFLGARSRVQRALAVLKEEKGGQLDDANVGEGEEDEEAASSLSHDDGSENQRRDEQGQEDQNKPALSPPAISEESRSGGNVMSSSPPASSAAEATSKTENRPSFFGGSVAAEGSGGNPRSALLAAIKKKAAPSTTRSIEDVGGGAGGGGSGAIGLANGESGGGGRGAFLAALLAGRGGGPGRGGREFPLGKARGLGKAKDLNEKDIDADLNIEYETERENFIKGMQEFIMSVEARVGQVSTECATLDRQARALYEYFGEEPMTASSSRILNTLWNFLRALSSAKAAYEQRHGPILTPDMLEDGEGALPIIVGQRIASVYGSGVIEAVRVRDRVNVVRLSWCAVGFMKVDALVGIGREVQTPYGKGIVLGVERNVGTYQVRLEWGALMYMHPSKVRPTCRKAR